jgi:hypothetical protein
MTRKAGKKGGTMRPFIAVTGLTLCLASCSNSAVGAVLIEYARPDLSQSQFYTPDVFRISRTFKKVELLSTLEPSSTKNTGTAEISDTHYVLSFTDNSGTAKYVINRFTGEASAQVLLTGRTEPAQWRLTCKALDRKPL